MSEISNEGERYGAHLQARKNALKNSVSSVSADTGYPGISLRATMRPFPINGEHR
jgi:hypothetical protein